MERKLAAILAADVVGYSRLMEADEADTFERVRVHRKELFEPEIEKHHGRIFKLMGDGLLAEFGSAVDAVECAAVVQREMATRNNGLPDDRRIDVRIGVHVGDVIVEGEDRHGDAVNVVARLQQLAEPGAICVSRPVVDHVKQKVALGFELRGEEQLKNIAEPVRVYRVLLDPAAAGRAIDSAQKMTRSWRRPAIAASVVLIVASVGIGAWLRPWEPRYEPASPERMALPLPDTPSIAVLPFANMSDDPKQEYFADGITDDLITSLSQVSGLFVIARNSTFTYKAKAVTITQVAEDLGVRYVLEGTVQRAGDRVRINARLIDAFSGGHVWADRFDGSVADIFALQDKVTRNIAEALAVRLTVTQLGSVVQKETSVPAAYDAFLRGWEHYRRTTPDENAKAIPYFEEAIRLDPRYWRAYAALALIYVRSLYFEEAIKQDPSYGHAALALIYLKGISRQWTVRLAASRDEVFGRARKYLEVVKEHPTSTARQAAGLVFAYSDNNDAAIAELKEAIALDPGDSWTYAYLAFVLLGAGRPAEAASFIETAMRVDPHAPPVFMYYRGLAHFGMDEFEDAAASLESVTKLNPEDQWPFVILAATYGHLGRKQEAMSAIARFNGLSVEQGGIPLTIHTAPTAGFGRPTDKSRLIKGLRLAGVPEFIFGSDFGEQNKLTADEVRLLLFGHRLHGRNPTSGYEHAAVFTPHGAVTISGNWGSGVGRIVRFDGDNVCFDWSGYEQCATLFRNPGGTKEKENEFIWFDSSGAFPFSQAD